MMKGIKNDTTTILINTFYAYNINKCDITYTQQNVCRQHTQHNDTQHKGLICDTKLNNTALMLIFIISVLFNLLLC